MVEDVGNDIDFVGVVIGKFEDKAGKKASTNITLATLLKNTIKIFFLITHKEPPLSFKQGWFFMYFKIVLSKAVIFTQASLLIQSCHALAGFLAFGGQSVNAQP